jgi:hypothetical protein
VNYRRNTHQYYPHAIFGIDATLCATGLSVAVSREKVTDDCEGLRVVGVCIVSSALFLRSPAVLIRIFGFFIITKLNKNYYVLF